MPSELNGPKKTAAGYFLALQPPVVTPELRWADEIWHLNAAWTAWATTQRDALLKELMRHPSWFSRPPRIEILTPMFSPWTGRTMAGIEAFMTDLPVVPGARTGRAEWALEGLLMSSTAVKPVWAIHTQTADPEADTISLFGDGETVADSDSEKEDTREIQFEDIEEGPPATAPTRIRNREWEARKFMAKERVREARLKAQIADRLALKEERRFYTQFGDLDDGESHFSEYDLTDDETSESVSALSEA